MAIQTAANIITTASKHGLATSQIKDSEIEATEFARIRTAVGKTAYDTIVEDAGETYGDLYGYLQTALGYYVIADIIERINTEVSDRGLFALQAENAQKPQRDTVSAVKAEHMAAGNAYIAKAIQWMVDNEFTDYTANMTETAYDYIGVMVNGNEKRTTRL